jgi:hypothetical protein
VRVAIFVIWFQAAGLHDVIEVVIVLASRYDAVLFDRLANNLAHRETG